VVCCPQAQSHLNAMPFYFNLEAIHFNTLNIGVTWSLVVEFGILLMPIENLGILGWLWSIIWPSQVLLNRTIFNRINTEAFAKLRPIAFVLMSHGRLSLCAHLSAFYRAIARLSSASLASSVNRPWIGSGQLGPAQPTAAWPVQKKPVHLDQFGKTKLFCHGKCIARVHLIYFRDERNEGDDICTRYAAGFANRSYQLKFRSFLIAINITI